MITIGKITDAANNLDVPGGPPFSSGAPAHFPEAKLFIMLVDPSKNAFVPGTSADGNGTETNVRTLYQACTHLGCTPNFCPKNYWFECPCHGSRYDRLGTKVANLGPAPRSLDRFWSQVARGRDPHGRYRQADPRAAAGRPRPARPDPAGLPDGLPFVGLVPNGFPAPAPTP